MKINNEELESLFNEVISEHTRTVFPSFTFKKEYRYEEIKNEFKKKINEKLKDKLESKITLEIPPKHALNLWQKLRVLMGVDYVVLIHFDGQYQVKPVIWVGETTALSAPYLRDTAGLLLPNGEWIGKSFIDRWLPTTKRTQKLFDRKD